MIKFPLSIRQKKRVIAVLMAFSSILLAYFLLRTTTGSGKTIKNFAEVDSVITTQLLSFNLPYSSIKSRTFEIDSTFSRKQYSVRIPRNVSKTLIHLSIDQELRRWDITSPSIVTFPNRDLHVHLTLNNTIFRSIILKSDSSMVNPRYPISIVFISPESPSTALIQRIRDTGDFLPIIFRTTQPDDAEDWIESIEEIHPLTGIWINDPSTSSIIQSEGWQKDKLLQFGRINSTVDVFIDQESLQNQKRLRSLIKSQQIRQFSMKQVSLLPLEEGVFEAEQKWNQLLEEAQQGQTPVLFARLSSESVSFILDRIVLAKRSGIQLIPIPTVQ